MFQEAWNQYERFLLGEISVPDSRGTPIFCNSEFSLNGTVRYTLADMTGDSIPELHVIGRAQYLFEDLNLSADEWEERTKPFLQEGNNQIRFLTLPVQPE